MEDKPSNSCDIDVANVYCLPVNDYIDKINDYLIPNPWEVTVIILYIGVFVVGVLGNFLVCFVVLRNEYMRTVTNVFLVNLAVGDFLVLIFCLPFTLVEDIRETWYFGSTICKLVKYLQSVSVTVSVLTLVVISMERWFAVCFPLKFKATTTRAVISIVIIWFLGCGGSLFQVMMMDIRPWPTLPQNVTLLTGCVSIWEPSSTFIFKAIEFSILFALPFILMSGTYLTIGLTLWFATMPGISESQRLNQGGQGRSNNAIDNTLRSRKRAALMLIVIVIMFFVCYMPVHIIHFIKIASSNNAAAYSLGILAIYAHWLCFFNSAINPVIYNFMSLKFRREFRRAMLCKKRRHRAYISTGGCHSIGMRQLHGNGNHTEQYLFTDPTVQRGLACGPRKTQQEYIRPSMYQQQYQPQYQGLHQNSPRYQAQPLPLQQQQIQPLLQQQQSPASVNPSKTDQQPQTNAPDLISTIPN